ncbi:hypothetical protein B9Z19DRAFT_1075503 [Tuber borchii]|uniref:Uncharacterized protein n=1 Tax=Tuber borchii TaxID=42251 RepID=A0A2T7A3C1_TUBBO|nr:hypothetical protein B9Z19DRAFT_1075503 [Tuber borchii]
MLVTPNTIHDLQQSLPALTWCHLDLILMAHWQGVPHLEQTFPRMTQLSIPCASQVGHKTPGTPGTDIYPGTNSKSSLTKFKSWELG